MDIDRGKILVVGFQDDAQRFSPTNLLPDVGEKGLDRFLFGLIDEYA
jgi:hypothetical protein